ncbi:hypothetical protein [Amycolatopsis thermoflava]|uniref:hypothetical protein n=1 Tax=Amycolatopsis thermoflava TaxID=84480 RepID=UPI003F49F987
MTAAADLQVPNVETVLRRAATRLARAAGYELLDEGQVLQLVDVVRDQIVHPLVDGAQPGLAPAVTAELEGLRAKLAEAQREANGWKELADRWERDHQTNVLPYTGQLETERDQARAARAALWELCKAAVRERGQAWAEAARLEGELEAAHKQAETWQREYERVRDEAAETIAERSSSDGERHRHYYPAEQPGQPPGPCLCGKPWPRTHTDDPDDEPATEPDPWDRIFAGLRDELADWPPQNRSTR